MARFGSFRDGGKTDEVGISQYLDKLFPGEVITGFNATQMDTPGMGVEVQIGSAFIPSGDNYPYVVFMDAAENVTLATADGSNPRIDLIVAYVDLTVVDNTSPNNPNMLVLENITGTPSGSPSIPNTAAIQAVIGASNPYIILAQVAVAAAATTITNVNVTDRRTFAQVDSSSNVATYPTAWVPTWSAASGGTSIGNGTLVASYIQIGKIVHFRIRLTFGSTTAGGTGIWTFTLPLTASSSLLLNDPIGVVHTEDTGVASSAGVVTINTTTTIRTWTVDSTTTMRLTASNFPFTWGNTDVIRISGTYEAA